MVTSPAVGRSRPVSILIVVLLPAPLGPRKPKKRPRGTSKETSSTATFLRKALVRWRTTMAGPGAAVMRMTSTPRPRPGQCGGRSMRRANRGPPSLLGADGQRVPEHVAGIPTRLDALQARRVLLVVQRGPGHAGAVPV